VITGIVVMVNLGLWQHRRLEERQAFNAEVRERSAQPIEDIGVLVGPATVPEDVEWRAVRVVGEYLADEQVVIVNRSQSGSAGFEVVTPLTLADGSLLLVDRGFVPLEEPVPDPPAGAVTVEGRLHASQERTLGQLSDPAEGDLGEFHRVDIDRIARQLPRLVAPVYLDLRTSQPDQGTPPYPIADPELSEGPHLSYMVQWFIFSAAVAVGWVLAVRHSVAKRRKQAAAVSEVALPTGPSA
jgi:cytochrome oxidase assembly protein ShyY1